MLPFLPEGRPVLKLHAFKRGGGHPHPTEEMHYSRQHEAEDVLGEWWVGNSKLTPGGAWSNMVNG